MLRKRIAVEGIVQGVGFRPFVYQIAHRWGVSGWILNDSRGVLIEVEGQEESLKGFIRSLQKELPPLASISRMDISDLALCGEPGFSIRQSRSQQERTAQISPDTFVCPECLEELFDPDDRRFRYPFINCTNCGPRYTIVTDIPYDRPNTTMAAFPMCPACQAEYDDPASRRFHAQPNACPVCGPQLTLWDCESRQVQTEDPVSATVQLLKEGRIVAVKGLGGYHLAVDATNNEAVAELRSRKARDEKPFAVMSFGQKDVDVYAEANEMEGRLLGGVERPIVLLRQKEGHPLSPLVAPRNRYFGVMLPYTPLHYLLLKDNFLALVMTSGNISDEPIAFEDGEARVRLSGLADFFLTHNRDIFIRTDDSIARVMAGKALLLRRSRGYVPRSVFLPHPQVSVLAVGAELKNTVCLTQHDRAFLSQHVGDLKNLEVFESFKKTIGHLEGILSQKPQVVAHDLHPDYYSTHYAEELAGVKKMAVQHHHAHMASCLAENGVEDEAIGVIFDGIGYGADGKVWGGEFLLGDCVSYRRAGHFRYLPMPGGDAATKEPYRMAISYLYQAFGKDMPQIPLLESVPEKDQKLLLQMIEKGINSPLTSSCGRLFDGVAALVGLRKRVSYEGQAALELEMAIEGEGTEGEYQYELEEENGLTLFDWRPLIRGVVQDVLCRQSVSTISSRFHNTLAAMVKEVCMSLRDRTGLNIVALSGGVFQNCYLTEKVASILDESGFHVYTHSLVPPNDGGLGLGQAIIAGNSFEKQ